MRSARLVIIRAGQGDHLLWECEQASSMLSPHQLVFLILDIRADEYNNFATTIHARLGLYYPRFLMSSCCGGCLSRAPILAWSNLGSLCSPNNGRPSSCPSHIRRGSWENSRRHSTACSPHRVWQWDHEVWTTTEDHEPEPIAASSLCRNPSRPSCRQFDNEREPKV